MQFLLPSLYFLSMAAALAAAIVFRKELITRKLGILIPFLLYGLIQETGIMVYKIMYEMQSSALLYNIYRPISAIVIGLIYLQNPTMRRLRMVMVGILAGYLLLTIGNYTFLESLYQTSSYMVVARGLVVSSFAFLFLYTYFHLDDAEEEGYWRPLLWFTIGVIVFYPVVTIASGSQRFLIGTQSVFAQLKIYQFIPQTMSILMYTAFIYAFYLCRKITPRFSS